MMDEWDVMTETDHLDADWSLIPGSDLNLDQTDSSVLANRVLLPTGKSKFGSPHKFPDCSPT